MESWQPLRAGLGDVTTSIRGEAAKQVREIPSLLFSPDFFGGREEGRRGGGEGEEGRRGGGEEGRGRKERMKKWKEEEEEVGGGGGGRNKSG